MYQQPALPYKYGDLEPFLSKKQVKVHYEEHHAGYYHRLNTLLSGQTDLDLESIIVQIEARNQSIYNNAAQCWNHDFYWKCLSPNGGKTPKGLLHDTLIKEFGSFDTFKQKFIFAAQNQFGSGWGWLILDKSNRIYIETTDNARCPLGTRTIPLLNCDLWEHAYYLDYKSKRGDYLEQYFDKINWLFVEKRFEQAQLLMEE